jgi:hypothetical protein
MQIEGKHPERITYGGGGVGVMAEDNEVLLKVLSRGQGNDGRDYICHQTRNNLDKKKHVHACMTGEGCEWNWFFGQPVCPVCQLPPPPLSDAERTRGP